MTVTDDIARVRTWRDEGADEATIAWCRAERRLGEIVDERHDRWRHEVVVGPPGPAPARIAGELATRHGLAPHPLTHGQPGREQNIDRELVPAFLDEPSVAVLHAKATAANIEMLARLGVAPIVVTEPWPVLLRRAADELGRGGPFDALVHVPRGFGDRPSAARLRFAAHACTPWLVSFLASWQEAAGELDVRWRSAPAGGDVTLPDEIESIARAIAAPYHAEFDLAPLGLGAPRPCGG
jgi:hypothetical protein